MRAYSMRAPAVPSNIALAAPAWSGAVRRGFITWLTNSLIVFAGAVAISLGIGFVPIGVPSEE